MTSKYIGSRSSLPKIATFGPPRAEKLIFSDKTLACSNDCAPKHKSNPLMSRNLLFFSWIYFTCQITISFETLGLQQCVWSKLDSIAVSLFTLFVNNETAMLSYQNVMKYAFCIHCK